MRLLDEQADKAIDRVTIYLTQSEAEELRDSVLGLLREPSGNHSHILSEDYKKEITVCIYNKDTISTLDERSQRLINTDT